MMKNAFALGENPFAAVQKAMLEAVDAMVANNEKVSTMAQAEIAKLKNAATEQSERAQALLEANVKAAQAASEAYVAGAEELSTLIQAETTAVIDGRVAAVKSVIGAKDAKAALEIQAELAKVEQEKAAAFTDGFVKLAQKTSDAALKPLQAQVESNLKGFDLKAA